MSRPLLAILAALVAFALLAPLANAQTQAGGTLTVSGLATMTTNQTQVALPFTVAISLNQGTCIGGGTTTVALAATKTGTNGTVEVQPASLSFPIPSSGTANGKYTTNGGASLIIKVGLVRSNVTVPYTVTGTSSTSCSTPAIGMPGSSFTGEQGGAVTFMPVSEEIANGTTQAMPGLGLPVLLALVVLVGLASRRQA